MSASAQMIADLRSDHEHVRNVVRAAGSSFFWAMRSLPTERRQAIYAVYAFCRQVDDIADTDHASTTKRQALAAWRLELDALYRGRPTLAVTRALLPAIERYDLPKQSFVCILDGVAMDIGAPLLAPSRDTLVLYCDRVAGAVGRLCVDIFGASNADGLAVAGHLGQALQLTNILRDVDEDAGHGRVYLPRETLDAHGIEPLDAGTVLGHAGFPAACEDVAAWAAQAFAAAAMPLARCDAKAMLPARMMMNVYHRSLDRLRARGFAPPRRPVALSRPRKLWIALRTSFGG